MSLMLNSCFIIIPGIITLILLCLNPGVPVIKSPTVQDHFTMVAIQVKTLRTSEVAVTTLTECLNVNNVLYLMHSSDTVRIAEIQR